MNVKKKKICVVLMVLVIQFKMVQHTACVMMGILASFVKLKLTNVTTQLTHVIVYGLRV